MYKKSKFEKHTTKFRPHLHKNFGQCLLKRKIMRDIVYFTLPRGMQSSINNDIPRLFIYYGSIDNNNISSQDGFLLETVANIANPIPANPPNISSLCNP